jgi:glycosyltransferase involved in cell wall biosynthesis
MKILFITHKYYPDIGGIEINSEVLAIGFHNAGHEVRMVTWTENIGDKIFPFTIIRKPGTAVLFKEHRSTDIIFENNPSLRLSWPAIFFNKPIVIALCTWVNRRGNGLAWQDRLKQFWLKRANVIIAVSEAVRKRNWPPAVVVSNPYRDDLFRVLPNTNRNRDFVFMGRLVPDKGADIAIKALAKLVDQNTFYTLTIVGSGPQEQQLKELVQQLGVSDRVNFTGALRGEALVLCLNEHKYMLVPSTWEEPFGNVALEGMACGCLPIVSDGGGLPDAVGKAGLVVARGNAYALADSIKELLNNAGLEAQLRNEANAHLAVHRPDIITSKYLQILEAAAGQSK